MTDYFASASGDDSDGLTFDKAKNNIGAAITLLTTGDRLFVHYTLAQNYTGATDQEYNGVGTPSNPCYITAVDEASSATSGTDGDAFTYTPMAQTLTAGVLDAGLTVNNASAFLLFGGNWHIRGVNFVNRQSWFHFQQTANGTTVFEDCLIGSAYSLASAMRINVASASAVLRNVSLYLAGALTAIQVISGGRFEMYGGNLHADHGGNVELFDDISGASADIYMEGFDCSVMPATSYPMSANLNVGPVRAVWKGCHLSAVPVLSFPEAVGSYSDIRAYPSAHAADPDLVAFEAYSQTGQSIEVTTVYLNGERDGIVPYSILAENTPDTTYEFSIELQELILPANPTLTVHITSSVQVYDDEVWITVHGPSAAQAGQRAIQSSRSDFANRVVIPTDAVSSWTGGQTYKQVITLNLAGFQAGPHTIMAHTSYVELFVFFDPEPGVA